MVSMVDNKMCTISRIDASSIRSRSTVAAWIRRRLHPGSMRAVIQAQLFETVNNSLLESM